MDEQKNVVYTYDGVSSVWKGKLFLHCDHMDEFVEYCAKWKQTKPDREKQTVYDDFNLILEFLKAGLKRSIKQGQQK